MTGEEITRLARLAGINCDMAQPGEVDTWYGNQWLPDGALRRFALLVEESCRAQHESDHMHGEWRRLSAEAFRPPKE